MKRIDIIYEKIKEIDCGNGVTAAEIADTLGIARPNVSSDLNKLCEEGKVSKTGAKPVYFKVIENVPLQNQTTIFDTFGGNNQSLYSAIEQAKAAVLYPPDGMHILLLGETGTGKSMFAGLIHQYAVEMKRKDENAPFVVFNCADYASNPQLILGQLFGIKKGAFTGADIDKKGLIEKADGGVLFLDEVHRLPPEGQEMFFTFMDKGTYRRLGETDVERHAKVLIICATTENPESALLKTFTRRIPMVIHIPSLAERSIEERFNLICKFMKDESARLGRPIMVSVNSIKAFLGYNCENNIGQLKTDIQLACAKAYADFVSHKRDDIKISSLDLPGYIKEGLYEKIGHRQLWNKLVDISKRYCVFDKDDKNVFFESDESNQNIYEMIDSKVYELKNKGISSEDIRKKMDESIRNYFTKYIYNVDETANTSNIENIVDPEIINAAEEIIKFGEEKLERKLSKKIHYGIVVHISNSIERIKHNMKIVNPQLNEIRLEYKSEFNVAVDCLKIIDREFDISMPIDEAGFLAIFFAYDDKKLMKKGNVNVIVIAHGTSTASSMVDVTNRLLGVKYAVGIDAPLEEKPKDIFLKLESYIRKNAIKSDILFLVDMGSLTNFGEEIEHEFGMKTKTLTLVSTLHVIEATRKAMLGYTLDEVYKDTMSVNTMLNNTNNEIYDNKAKKCSIVTICTTGEGSALVMKNLLLKQLNFDKKMFEIVSMSLLGSENVNKKLREIEKTKRIMCIVSPFKIDTDIPQFSIDEVVEHKAEDSIQKMIDIENTYNKIGETFGNQLKNIDGKTAINDIKQVIDRIEENINTKIDTKFLIGIALHMGCMIDRLVGGGTIDSFDGREKYISDNVILYDIVKKACSFLNEKYNINITDDEICHIMLFFNPKNYK